MKRTAWIVVVTRKKGKDPLSPEKIEAIRRRAVEGDGKINLPEGYGCKLIPPDDAAVLLAQAENGGDLEIQAQPADLSGQESGPIAAAIASEQAAPTAESSEVLAFMVRDMDERLRAELVKAYRLILAAHKIGVSVRIVGKLG